MIRTLTAPLAVALLASLGSAQQVVDQTLQTGSTFQPTPIVNGGARAASECDDFNRANSTNMGASWSEINGDLEVLSNKVHGVISMSRMIHTTGSAPYAGSSVEFDLDGSSTSLVYAAAFIGYNAATGEDIMVKVQNQSGAPGYNTYGFYHANNGGGYGGWGGFRAFPSQIPTGHVTVSVDATGDVVTLAIDTDFNGTTDFTDSAAGLLASGLASLLGSQHGFGAYGPEYTDNWELNGGCSGPPTPTIAVSGLVAGGTVTITATNCTAGGKVRHGYSLAGGGPVGTPFGNLLLSPPYTELPFMTMNGSGTGSFSGAVPPGTTGISVWLHAFDLGSLTFTNGIATAIG